LPAGRPQRLAQPGGVVRDQCVRALEYGGARAVVLFEAEQPGLGKILAELLQVLDSRSAPAIDRLVVVADHERRTLAAYQQSDPRVLNRVRVLEFIDQHVPE